jgi:hypothetical protein
MATRCGNIQRAWLRLSPLASGKALFSRKPRGRLKPDPENPSPLRSANSAWLQSLILGLHSLSQASVAQRTLGDFFQGINKTPLKGVSFNPPLQVPEATWRITKATGRIAEASFALSVAREKALADATRL